MDSVYIRFKIVKEKRSIEVKFDSRLSFTENFRLMNYQNLDKLRVYDPNRKIFLDRNVPIGEMHISGFMTFYLY